MNNCDVPWFFVRLPGRVGSLGMSDVLYPRALGLRSGLYVWSCEVLCMEFGGTNEDQSMAGGTRFCFLSQQARCFNLSMTGEKI